MQLLPTLEEAIQRSVIGLIVITPRALASGWVALELDAMERQRVSGRIRIVALQIDSDCPPPHGIAPENIIHPPNRNDLTDIADRVAHIVRTSSSLH
jgi:hypothetical protein